MSAGRNNPPFILPPDEYQATLAQIEGAKAYLRRCEEKMDEGKQNFEVLRQQLEDKIRAGDDAKRMLEEMQQQQQRVIMTNVVPPARQLPAPPGFQASAPQVINAASTSRIEEVSQYEHSSSNHPASIRGYQREPARTQVATSSNGASSVAQSGQRNHPTNQSHLVYPDQQWNTQSGVRMNHPQPHPQPHGQGANNRQPQQSHQQQTPQTQPHQFANSFSSTQSRAQTKPETSSQSPYSLQLHASVIGNTSNSIYRPAHVRQNESSSLAGALGTGKGSIPVTQVATSTASTHGLIRTSVPANTVPAGPAPRKFPPPVNPSSRGTVPQPRLGPAPQKAPTLQKPPANTNPRPGLGSAPQKPVHAQDTSRGMPTSTRQAVPPPLPKTGTILASASESTRNYFPPLHADQLAQLKTSIHNCQIDLHPGTFRILCMSPYLRIYKDALSVTAVVFPGHNGVPYSLSVNDFIALLDGNPTLQAPQSLSVEQWPMQLPEREQIFTPRAPATNSPSIPMTPDNSAAGNKQHAVSRPNTTVPATPPTSMPPPVSGTLRSPAQADKRTLARDVMFALGKRGRESASSPNLKLDREVKRHATEQKVQGTGVMAPPSGQAGHVVGLTSSLPTIPLRPLENANIQVVNSSQTSLPASKLQEGTEVAEATMSSETLKAIVVTPAGATQSSTENGATSTAQAIQPSTPRNPTVQPQSLIRSSASIGGSFPVVGPLSLAPGNDLVKYASDSTGDLPAAGTSNPSPHKASVDMSQQNTVTEPQTVTPSTSNGGNIPVASSSTPPARKPLFDSPSAARNALANHGVDFSFSPPLRKDDPLFLPSPSSSPSLGNMNVANRNNAPPIGVLSGDALESTVGATDSTTINDEKQLDVKGKQREQPFYILIPPAPEYLVRFRAQQIEKEQKAVRASRTLRNNRDRTRTESLAPSAAGEDFDFTFDPQGRTVHDVEEREVMRLACSRVQEVPCKWGGCDVVMNSVEGLVIHVKSHLPQSKHSKPEPYTCLWKNCGRRCRVGENHVEMHALGFLRCAYEGCEDTFRSSTKLLKHVQAEHKNDKPRLANRPIAPSFEDPLPPAPPVLPSYMVLSRKVQQASISDDRHTKLGPWVLRNIAGLERQKPNKQKAARSMRGTLRDGVLDGEVGKTYEYLTRRSTRYSSSQSEPVDLQLEKLDSAAISQMLSEGLSLWDTEDQGESVEGSQMSTTPPRAIMGLSEDIKAEGLDVTIRHLSGSAGEDADRNVIGYP